MSKSIKLKRGDILLLLLYVDNCAKIKGRTRLQKMVFVFEKELLKKYGFDKQLEMKKSCDFEFNAHNYGPFSKKVFELMDFFVNIKMVDASYSNATEEAFADISDLDIAIEDLAELNIDLEEEAIPNGEPVYCLTETGKNYVQDKLLKFISAEQIQALTQLKKSFNEYSLNNILKYVYTKYPDMAKESLVREKVLGTKWTS
jgi:uncharacterized protein YwgA